MVFFFDLEPHGRKKTIAGAARSRGRSTLLREERDASDKAGSRGASLVREHFLGRGNLRGQKLLQKGSLATYQRRLLKKRLASYVSKRIFFIPYDPLSEGGGVPEGAVKIGGGSLVEALV